MSERTSDEGFEEDQCTQGMDAFSTDTDGKAVAKTAPFDFSTLNGPTLTCICGPFPWRDIFMYEESECVYFADIFECKPNTPDIKLHRGGKEGPVVGAARFRYSKKNMKMGVGSDELNLEWVELQRRGIRAKNKTQRFQWAGQSYLLTHLSPAERAINGAKVKGGTHLKVVEEHSGQLVAGHVCTKATGQRKATTRFEVGISSELHVLIALAITTWREIRRRDS